MDIFIVKENEKINKLVVCAKLFWTVNPPQLNSFFICFFLIFLSAKIRVALQEDKSSALFYSLFFAIIILIVYYMCLYALVCDYLSLCVLYLELVDFWLKRVF
jgi:cell division protein FtsW (lipid II flippase)